MEKENAGAVSSLGETSSAGDISAALVVSAIPPDQYELRILKSLRQIIRTVEIHSRKLDHDFQITGPQLACLLAIREKSPITVTHLAESVFLSPGTVVGIVDRLEEKGLAQRTRSKKDRRLVEIAITEAGRELAVKAPSPIHGVLAGALKNLPEDQQVTIAESLDKLVQLMNAGGAEAVPILTIGSMTEKF